ncbi:MAG: Mut7-C RNAse domain-containing protein [Chloroflexi bacterium]|nr:Mut7-C RNAse domain-containing protein [Chloroflexota bacterium]
MENTGSSPRPKFIADQNVGKLAKWLRMMGYDTTVFEGEDDSRLVRIAMNEDRVILTRDTHIMRRRVAKNGLLKIILISSDEPELQVKQVVQAFKLDCQFQAFTLCLECNQPLQAKSKQQVKDLVPPYVFQTQSQYVECPACHRIYWRGTHWAAMTRKLERVLKETNQENDSRTS